MWLRRALIAPHVLGQAVRAPREQSRRWDLFWSATAVTGDSGTVLWDPSTADEARRYVEHLRTHADPDLPVVDVGCGNGRFSRALAPHFPRVLGVDLSPAAAELAARESVGVTGVGFRALDVTTPGAGARLYDELGPAHVFVRGLLHTLSPADRRATAANVAQLLGSRGTLLVAETNFDGNLLGYFESLGASGRGLPAPLGRAISAGLPRPAPFGERELDECFPPSGWERIHVGTTAIRTVPMRTPGVPDSITGLLAVLRPRAAADPTATPDPTPGSGPEQGLRAS